MDTATPEQVHLKVTMAVDKSTATAGILLKRLWSMDKSMLEQGQQEEFIAVLNPMAWPKGSRVEIVMDIHLNSCNP